MREQTSCNFKAENGLIVRIRPLKPADAPYLVDLFNHLSDDSRYQRFNLALANAEPEWVLRQAEKLAYVRPGCGRAWIAFADLAEQPHAPVAGIRYIRSSPNSAEVSLVVRDDLQNLGIGRELLRYAGRQAYADGIEKLVGMVQSTNLALWHSLSNLGVPVQHKRDGAQTVVEVVLPEARTFRWKRGRLPKTASGE